MNLEMKVQSAKRRIAKPDDEDLFVGRQCGLEEDDPSVHENVSRR